ncbi:MAG: DoxX family protein [Alphaproteobacteria bacterium]
MTHDTSSAKLIVPAMAGVYDRVSGLSYPLIRFFAGVVLMPHGAQKLFGMFNGGDAGIAATAGFFSEVGLEPAVPLAYLVGSVEFFGGLCVAIGFLTRPAAACVVALMAVAMFQVHLPEGFFWYRGGYEYPMLWGIIALGIFLRGGDAMSVDKAIGREF